MKKNRLGVLVTLLLLLLTSSCEIGQISKTQLQLERYSLKKADLPRDWSFNGESWDVIFGGESYTISYLQGDHVFMSHTVSILPSEDQARQAYEEWESDWFDDTNLLPGVHYSPMGEDDDFRYECEELQPGHPLKVCFYLQRHSELISFVQINLDSQSNASLTFEEINDILGVLDKRLNEVAIDAEPEDAVP